MLRLIASTLVSTVLFSALVMGPALSLIGSMDWPTGWMVVAVCSLSSLIGGLYFQATDPRLVQERAKVPTTKSAGDALATLVIVLCVVAFCAGAVYDGLELHLLPLSPAVTWPAGLSVFAVGIAIIVWTFRKNTFATTVVEIQTDRSQRTIDTGPYRFVRHPMYFGAVWYFAGVATMLGSAPMALAAIVIIPLVFLPRMLEEERVLTSELPGYADYKARVRARILPGVF